MNLSILSLNSKIIRHLSFKTLFQPRCSFRTIITRTLDTSQFHYTSHQTKHYSTFSNTLSWNDHEDIAQMLYDEYPTKNPLTLRFTVLHDDVIKLLKSQSIELTGECSEHALEQIQMAWLELYEDGL